MSRRDTYVCIYMCPTYVSLLRNNTYITAMYIFTYETPTYSTSLPSPSLPFPSVVAAFLRHSIFLASFLIWPTKSTLALCVLVSPPTLCIQYGISISYRYTHAHPHAYQSAIIHSLLASASSLSHLRFQFVRFNNSQFNKC